MVAAATPALTGRVVAARVSGKDRNDMKPGDMRTAHDTGDTGTANLDALYTEPLLDTGALQRAIFGNANFSDSSEEFMGKFWLGELAK